MVDIKKIRDDAFNALSLTQENSGVITENGWNIRRKMPLIQ